MTTLFNCDNSNILFSYCQGNTTRKMGFSHTKQVITVALHRKIFFRRSGVEPCGHDLAETVGKVLDFRS